MSVNENIIYRESLNRNLTAAEVDSNFATLLNNDKALDVRATANAQAAATADGKAVAAGQAASVADGKAAAAQQTANSAVTNANGRQPANAKLTAIAGSVWAANQLLITTGADTLAMLATGATGRSLIAAADAAAARTALELGTAATATVTTSTTDTTAARILKYGDWGFTSTAISLPSTDLNTVTNPGRYAFGNGVTNGPANGVAYYVDVIRHGALVMQIAYGMTANFEGKMYTRLYSSTWSVWKEKSSVGDFGLGGYGITVLSTSINTLVASGFYYCNSANSGENLPVASNGYLLVHAQGSLYSKQVFSHVTDGRTWERFLVNNVWQNWDPILKGSNVTVSAGDIGAGRLLKNGDWGIGATNNAVTVGDLNVVSAGGIRRITPDSTNKPTGLNYGTVIDSMYEKTSENWAQLVLSITEPRAWIRSRINNAAPAVSEIYTKFNAVGNVSFSGGNTGAIIERGTGPQGNWTRYADGTLTMWGVFTSPSLPASDPVPSQVAISLPFNFVDTNFIVLAHAAPSSSWTGFDGCLFAPSGSTSYFTANIRNRTTAQTAVIHWNAIGRWRNV